MDKPLSAEEIVDQIEIRRLKAQQAAYPSLRSKCIAAINQMVRDMDYSAEIEVDKNDLMALIQVTEEMRDLNYKFRFIEVQNTSGDVVSHKLHISVVHAK